MTMHPPGGYAGASGFDALLAEVTAAAGRFGHREHVHLTWLAVRQAGVPAAVSLVSDGIQRTARYAGAPQKYHATISRAWVELVGHHAAKHGEDDFTAFAGHHQALLDKRLLARFYRPATLASPPGQDRLGRIRPRPVPVAGHGPAAIPGGRGTVTVSRAPARWTTPRCVKRTFPGFHTALASP